MSRGMAHRGFPVLGIRDFRFLLADRLIAPRSVGFSLVGVSFAVLKATNSATDLSYVLAAQIAPSLVFVLIGGVARGPVPGTAVMWRQPADGPRRGHLRHPGAGRQPAVVGRCSDLRRSPGPGSRCSTRLAGPAPPHRPRLPAAGGSALSRLVMNTGPDGGRVPRPACWWRRPARAGPWCCAGPAWWPRPDADGHPGHGSRGGRPWSG